MTSLLTSPISLIVTDVDGCVGRGEGRAYDLDVIQQLAEMNRAARRGEPVPAITLCTGRPGAYVDAMMQMLDGFMPAVFENGAGLYFSQGYRFAWNPTISHSARKTIQGVRALLEESIVGAGIGYFQPGKELALTLFPWPGHTLAEVGAIAEQSLVGRDVPCSVEVGVTSVGIWLDGINKGAGLHWLAEETGVPLDRMVGIGDDTGDISFLSLAGFSAAPQNAVPSVKAVVDYESPLEYGAAVLDIIEKARTRE
jgi:hydroxymethylpyrimidine pyrophosphatase-like HAD family hydrolase